MAAKKPTKTPDAPAEAEAPAAAPSEVEAEAPAKGDSHEVRKLKLQLAAALQKVADLEQSKAVTLIPGKKKKLEVPERFRGTKRYKVVKGPIYRKGVIAVGSIISLTNEVPSANLIEVDNAGNPVERDESEE